MARVELFYYPRQDPRDLLLEVVLFRSAPQQPLISSNEGQTVAWFVYAGDALAYATQRQSAVQTFLNSEGEVEAIFAEVGGEVEYATPEEGGYIHTFVEVIPGTAFAQDLWGIVVR